MTPKDLETIQSYIAKGYELTVRSRLRDHGKYHALVHLGTTATSYNFMGASVSEALEGLERYLKSSAGSNDV